MVFPLTAKVITADKMQILLERLLEDGSVYAPVKQPGNVIRYALIGKPEEAVLDFGNSDISPKDIFFPQTEEMFHFEYTGEGVDLEARGPGAGLEPGPRPSGPGSGLEPGAGAESGPGTGPESGLEPGPESEAGPGAGPVAGPRSSRPGPRIVLGMRACDVQALSALDPVFNGARPDPQYRWYRENTLIISLACERARATCFCNAFGIDPVAPGGADLVLIRHRGDYIVEECSGKGREFMEQYKDLFGTADIDPEGVKEERRSRLEGQFAHHLSPSRAKETMDKYFELPYWEEISRKCLGCGICTYICPTCHCFDIFDFAPEETAGSRYRCWDSCMYGDFTKMAGGHNPRPGKKERVRNRFMHKIKYHLDRYGVDGCVGCGRCIIKCPVNMDITSIITGLGEVT